MLPEAHQCRLISSGRLEGYEPTRCTADTGPAVSLWAGRAAEQDADSKLWESRSITGVCGAGVGKSVGKEVLGKTGPESTVSVLFKLVNLLRYKTQFLTIFEIFPTSLPFPSFLFLFPFLFFSFLYFSLFGLLGDE